MYFIFKKKKEMYFPLEIQTTNQKREKKLLLRINQMSSQNLLTSPL